MSSRVFSLYFDDYGCSPVPLRLTNPNGYKCGTEQGALYVGNLCFLEIINTIHRKEVSIADNYPPLCHWHSGSVCCRVAFGTAEENAGVPTALGSGVSERETWSLSVGYLWVIRPRESGLLLPRCTWKFLHQEINLTFYREAQTGCWLFVASSFPWRLGNLEKMWPLFWELCQTESVDRYESDALDCSQCFGQIV